jgi:hypothetical protein
MKGMMEIAYDCFSCYIIDERAFGWVGYEAYGLTVVIGICKSLLQKDF